MGVEGEGSGSEAEAAPKQRGVLARRGACGRLPFGRPFEGVVQAVLDG